jgi:putative ABC transport system substrate-binding protein
MRLLFLALFLVISPTNALADGKPKVLVLNSDSKVQKYTFTNNTFKSKLKSKLNYKIAEIDMSGNNVNESSIKKTISNFKPDVIYCIGARAYLTAHKLAKNRAIVFSSALNWKRLPISKNTYGVANELPTGMQLMIYRYFFPTINKIGVVYSKSFNKEWLKSAKKAANEIGVKIIGEPVGKPEEVGAALSRLLPKVDALWITPDPVVLSSTQAILQIFSQSNTLRKPVFAYNEVYARFGAVLVISADLATIGRQAAELTTKVVEHKKILSKIQDPAGSYITLNIIKVEKYGLDINLEAMDSVNRLIQ